MNLPISLDSGAFTAWSKGIHIDLDEYINFYFENQDMIDKVVGLDVIPGRPGYKDIPMEEREAAAAKGYENYLYMIKRGMPKDKTVVVFHQGDHFHWLERMRDEKIPYIGLSPANDRSTPEKMSWLDECMYYVTDSKGLPLMKWHGFAVTSVPIVRRYPWFSVDSATWLMFAAYGNILLPPQKGGVPDWHSDRPLVVGVSSSLTSSARSTEGEHISTFTGPEREYVERYLASIGLFIGESTFDYMPSKTKLAKNQGWRGKKLDDGTRLVETIVRKGVSNSLGARTRTNAYFFAKIRESLPTWPWPYKFRHGFGLTRSTGKTDLLCPYSDTGLATEFYFAGQAHEIDTTRLFMKRHGLEDSWRILVSFAYFERCKTIINYKRFLLSRQESV